MFIAAMGARGNLGRIVVSQGLERGHTFRAVSPHMRGTGDPRVRGIAASDTDHALLLDAFRGTAAVVIVFPAPVTHPYDYPDQVRRVFDAALEAGVPRVIGSRGHGLLPGDDAALLPRRRGGLGRLSERHRPQLGGLCARCTDAASPSRPRGVPNPQRRTPRHHRRLFAAVLRHQPDLVRRLRPRDARRGRAANALPTIRHSGLVTSSAGP